MGNVRFVGLDVHKESIVIAVADEGRSEPQVVREIPHDVPRLMRELQRLRKDGALRCCYEAGPTGFGLCRALREAKIDCVVIAPSLIPAQVGSRVKTDKRDAIKLARFHRSGDLTAVHVPDEATEAMRDLERARDDAKNAQRVARHQLSKFLLRHGRRYGKPTWTKAHLDWAKTQQFDHEAHNRVLVDYVHAVEEASARVARFDKDIAELVETWSLKPLVAALQALRGIQLLSAVAIAAELGSVTRFDHPRKLMSFVGLVPSERSSGETVRRGGITRTGNKHLRRLLVEAAWSYRFRPLVGQRLRARSAGLSDAVRSIGWNAQRRLHDRYRRLSGRGKPKNQVVTAVARELCGFIWDIARQEHAAAA
jgi:transposase